MKLLTDELAVSVGPGAGYRPERGIEDSQGGYMRVLEQGGSPGEQSKVDCKMVC